MRADALIAERDYLRRVWADSMRPARAETPHDERVAEAIRAHGPVKPFDLWAAVSVPPAERLGVLNRLVAAGRIVRDYGGPGKQPYAGAVVRYREAHQS